MGFIVGDPTKQPGIPGAATKYFGEGYTSEKRDLPPGYVPYGLRAGGNGGVTATPDYTPPKTDIPFAPGPTCPEGESLYKVSGTQGTQYVYAPSERVAEGLAGGPGFVTPVMSPAAYGKDQPYKTITTVGGQQVQVPWDPTGEAKAEFSRIQGYYPYSSRLTEKSGELLSNIRSAMVGGTYTSPLTNIPVVQDIADRSGLSYQQALTEARTIADQVQREIATGGCAPWGLSEGEARIASGYLESVGRIEEAENIKNFYYSTGSTSERQLERAEATNYELFDELKDYRDGIKYDLTGAFAAGVIAENDIPTLKKMGFSEGMITGAVARAAFFSAVGVGIGAGAGITIETLGAALVAEKVTKDQIIEVYGDKVADEAVDYAAMFPGGIGAEVGIGADKTARISWDPIGAMVRWKIPIDPQTGKKRPAGPWEDWAVNVGDKVYYFTSKDEAIKWAEKNGYKVGIGFGTSMGMVGQTAWGVAQTPEFMIGSAGLVRFVGPGALVGAVPGRVGQALNWLTKPVQWGRVSQTGEVMAGKLVPAVAAGFVNVGKQFIIPTMATTGAATWAGLSYKPESPTVKGGADFQGFKTSPQYSEAYSEYMREAGTQYDRVVTSLGAGETMEVSKEEFLAGAVEDFDPQLREWFITEAGKGMEYQPGIVGLLGKGGAVANLPIQQVQTLPGPDWLKALGTGVYSVFTPLSVTSQLYPEHGLKSLTALLPYYGPVTAAGALTWKQQPWYGKLATVGFTLLPGVAGALGYLRAPKVSGRELQLRRLGIGRPPTGIGIAEPYTVYGRTSGGLTPLFKGARPIGDTLGPGVTARGISPAQVSGLRGGLAPKFGIKARLGRLLGGKVRPESELYPLREAQGYRPEYVGLPEGPVRPEVGFFAGGQPLGPYTYRYSAFSYPLEGSTPYVGGTVPQWTAKWADFGGRSGGLWGPGGIWSQGGGWTWGGGGMGSGGGGVATQSQVGVGTMVGGGPAPSGVQATLGIPTRPTFGLGLPYHPVVGIAPSTVFAPETLTITAPVVTPVEVPITVTPMSSKVVSPISVPVVSPTPIPVVSPIPFEVPFPGFGITPTPVTPIITPVEPGFGRPHIRTPFLLPPFGFGGLGGGVRRKKGKRGILGIGKWKFTGFPVAAPHPYLQKVVGYDWMKGAEKPYGARKVTVPKVRTKKGLGGGLVRMTV